MNFPISTWTKWIYARLKQIEVKQKKLNKQHSQIHDLSFQTRSSAAVLEKGRRKLTRNKRIVKLKPAKFLSDASKNCIRKGCLREEGTP